MQRNWKAIGKDKILKGNDEFGNPYRSQFLKDYHARFGGHTETLCERCVAQQIDKYFNTKTMSNVKSAYRLKSKYEGISLGFGSTVRVTNATLTDAIAKKLINNHNLGEALFDVVPEKKPAAKPVAKKSE